MAAAVAVLASNYHGRNDLESVRRTVSSGFRIILVMAVTVCVPLLVFRGQIGNLFTDDGQVAQMVSVLVIPFVIYQFGDGLQCNYSNALRGISDVTKVSKYAFIAYFLVSLPSAYVFAFVLDWGLLGIWCSFPLGLTTAGLLFYLRFRRTICRP
jgi:MATE family multidrug resistance protein